MTRWLVMLALAGALVACGGGGGSTPSATLATTPTTVRTTTTVSVEAEVEAAYLKSWDVYTDAVRTVDIAKLPTAYVDKALQIATDDVNRLRRDGVRAEMRVEHHYEIHVASSAPDVAQVIDEYVNHSVLVDAATGEPREPDPNKVLNESYLLKRTDGQWKVFDIQRAS
ncbi:MAG: hypothetical protein QOD30_2086 [Actinomycetota bacterium]|jgi:hypothetical protein|nr:hypothetical protein [Actinomycetota bacterium]